MLTFLSSRHLHLLTDMDRLKSSPKNTLKRLTKLMLSGYNNLFKKYCFIHKQYTFFCFKLRVKTYHLQFYFSFVLPN